MSFLAPEHFWASSRLLLLRYATLQSSDNIQRTTQYASAQFSSPSLHLGIFERNLSNTATICCFHYNISYGRRNMDRTCDLSLVRAALSQLSYPPRVFAEKRPSAASGHIIWASTYDTVRLSSNYKSFLATGHFWALTIMVVICL